MNRIMQIIVLKNSSQAPRSFETCHAITFEELIQEFKTGRIIKRLFRYRDAELLTARNDAVVHPFATAFMLRVLSHRYCRFRDERNQCLSITWMALLRLFFRLLRDALFKYPFLARIKREIRFLSNEYDTRRSPQSLDRTHRLLYLRSDLLFGLRAGGSVGHIAGVLNEFHRQGLNPLLCTIDRIPMVDSAVSTHFLPPGRAFWDYLELPSLQFNDGIEKTIDDIFGGERPSFIYQRYSVNNFYGVKLAKRFEVPFVLEYNGSEVWMSRHWGTPFKYERISASIEDLNLKAADLIVVVSRIMKEE